MAKKTAEYKVCPKCGDRILAEMPKSVCDVCDVGYKPEKPKKKK
jgi:NMD protein affecting ribosome stability and mRNA decay